jgi:hypothetical protein
MNNRFLKLFVFAAFTASGVSVSASQVFASACDGNPYCQAPAQNPSPNPAPSPVPSPAPSPAPTTGCSGSACGGTTTINGQPTQVSNAQSSNNSGAFFNQGGSSANFAINNSGDSGRSDLLGCSTASNKFGFFGTVSANGTHSDSLYGNGDGYGGSSLGVQLGGYAEFYANGQEKVICQSHGVARVLFNSVATCQDLKTKGVQYIPTAFGSFQNGKLDQRGQNFIAACNEMLRGQQIVITPPPTVFQTPPPAYTRIEVQQKPLPPVRGTN